MGKSLHIVLRKDMSLTRRLYSWLRLNETATTPESSNNLKKAFSVLVDALKVTFRTLQTPYSLFRTCLRKWS